MKLVQLQNELDRLHSLPQSDAAEKRIATINARINMFNHKINNIVALTGCKRSMLEKKHGARLDGLLEAAEINATRYEQARMLANASNARTQLRNWK